MAKILLVQDDVGESARLRRALREAGHEAEVAPGVADAEARAAGCDALVVDAACEGGEALAWARRTGASPGAPPAVIVGDEAQGLPAAPAAAALVAAVEAALARRAPPQPQPEQPPPARAAPRPALARTAEAALRALFGTRPARLGASDARARLEELAELARTGDYFEVLAVARDCSGEEARLAADVLLASAERDLEPVAAGEPALAPLLADLRQVLRDARDVLGDDSLREGYRSGLGPGAPPEVAEDTDKR